MVASNLSTEMSIVQLDRSSSSLIIMEPEDALKLPIGEGTTIVYISLPISKC